MTLDLDAIEARAKTGWEPATWNAENGKAKPERVCFLLQQSIDEAQAAVLSLTAEVRKLREALAEVYRAAHGGGPTAHRMLRVKQIIDEAEEPGA